MSTSQKIGNKTQFSSVQSLSCVRLFATPCTIAHQDSLSISNSWSLYSNSCPSSRCCNLTISSSAVPVYSHLQSFLASGFFPMSQFFASGGQLLEFQLQHHSFQWISRTDFHTIDWLDLLAVQGTLKSLLQHHSSKASIFWHSAFFRVQLSHPYMIIGKTIALTRTLLAK